jgi:predicted HTH transcriptional regulator
MKWLADRPFAQANLPPPAFEERVGQFAATIWRDWLTDAVISDLGLSERQQKAVAYLKAHGRITNKEYQKLTGVTDRTVLREFKELLAKGVLEKVGETGRGTHYVLRYKPDINPTNGTCPQGRRSQKGRIFPPNGPDESAV